MCGCARSDDFRSGRTPRQTANKGRTNHVQAVQDAAGFASRHSHAALVADLACQPRRGPQTIDDIIKKGKIVVGVSTTTPIFGLIGKDGEPEGYDPDVARLIGKYLGVKSSSCR